MAREIEEFIVIGYGSIGRRHTGNLISLNKILAGRADPRLAPLHPGDYTDSMECLEKEANGRLVVISSPTHLHAEHAIKAMWAGAAALYIEKPVAVNIPDCEQIMEVAEFTGTKIVVGYNFRYHPGVISMLQSIQVGRFFFSAFGIDDPTTWSSWNELGADSYLHTETGGILWTSTSHAVDLALTVHGWIDQVIAMEDSENNVISVRAHHENGGVSQLFNKWSEGHSPTSILAYISGMDTITVDLLNTQNTDMHRALMRHALTYYDKGVRDPMLPSIETSTHGVAVLNAIETSIKERTMIDV